MKMVQRFTVGEQSICKQLQVVMLAELQCYVIRMMWFALKVLQWFTVCSQGLCQTRAVKVTKPA